MWQLKQRNITCCWRQQMSKMIKAFTRKLIRWYISKGFKGFWFKSKCECVLLLNCHKSHTRADAFIYYHSCFQKPFLLLKHSRPFCIGHIGHFVSNNRWYKNASLSSKNLSLLRPLHLTSWLTVKPREWKLVFEPFLLAFSLSTK